MIRFAPILFLLIFLPLSCDTHDYKIDPSLSIVMNANKLLVGYTEQPLFSFTDEETETLKGIDIDLAREVAQRMGVRIQFLPVSAMESIQALDDIYIDLYWSGVELPAQPSDRNRNTLHSDIYLTLQNTNYVVSFKISAGMLRNEVNRILRQMQADGTISRITGNYLEGNL